MYKVKLKKLVLALSSTLMVFFIVSCASEQNLLTDENTAEATQSKIVSTQSKDNYGPSSTPGPSASNTAENKSTENKSSVNTTAASKTASVTKPNKTAVVSASGTPSVFKINKTNVKIDLEQTITLTTNFSSVKWSSNNPKVASVDNKGVVTGKIFGTAEISATVNNKTVTCKVTVDYLGVANKESPVTKNTWGEQQGEWLYFSNPDDNWTLYKYRDKDKLLIKLNDAVSSSINVSGKWIYYSKDKDGYYGELYKIRIDGTNDTRMITEEVSEVKHTNGWLICRRGTYGQIKLRIDGSGKSETVNEDYLVSYIKDNTYYFYGFGDLYSEGGSYWKGTVNNPKSAIVEKGIFDFTRCGDWIYYNTIDGVLYRVKNDGSSRKEIARNVHGIQTNGSLLFFYGDDSKIYRMNLDGTGRKVITANNKKIESFYVMGDFVLITASIPPYGLNREKLLIRTDGTVVFQRPGLHYGRD